MEVKVRDQIRFEKLRLEFEAGKMHIGQPLTNNQAEYLLGAFTWSEVQPNEKFWHNLYCSSLNYKNGTPYNEEHEYWLNQIYGPPKTLKDCM